MAPPFHVPTNKARGFHTFSLHLHQHLISLVFLVTNILRVVRRSPIVVLIRFYLIISHVSNFSCAFLDIYISSTFFSHPLPIFEQIFVFCFSCMSSAYIYKYKPLSNRWFAKISSNCLDCLFILYSEYSKSNYILTFTIVLYIFMFPCY